MRLRAPKGGHAVGDGLDTGEGDGTRREALQQKEEPEAPAGDGRGDRLVGVEGDGLDVPEERAEQPVPDQQGDADDVDVGGHGEDAARLLHAPQVGHRDDSDEDEAQQHPLMDEALELRQRDNGGHAGRDRHGHGEDVVDQKRCTGDQRRVFAQVLPADDVGAAATGIGVDRLPVGRDHDRQEDGDHDRDRDQVIEAQGQARPADGRDEQDLLGGVRRRGDGVRGEGRQGDRLRQELVLLLVGGDGAADQEPLQEGVHRALTIRPGRFNSAS